jgi:hypothetical protein
MDTDMDNRFTKPLQTVVDRGQVKLQAEAQRETAKKDERRKFRQYKRDVLREFGKGTIVTEDRFEELWKEGLSIKDAVHKIRHPRQ